MQAVSRENSARYYFVVCRIQQVKFMFSDEANLSIHVSVDDENAVFRNV